MNRTGEPAVAITGMNHVAVVGAGTIGASWAAYFLSRGLRVTASDPAPHGETFVRAFIARAWPTLERLGLAEGATPDALLFEPDPARAVAEADFVQESGPENADLKTTLFARMDEAARPNVILSSSSSTIVPSIYQVKCRHPGRVLLGHPFNPPHLIPLVEVVGGRQTAPDAVDRAMAFYAAAGRHPIRLNKEMPGHVSNRLQSALAREAAYLVEQGVVDVAGVDAAIAQGPGLRWAIMGPLLTFHLGGGQGGLRYLLEHIGTAQLWPYLGTPDMSPALTDKLVNGVDEEAAGRTIDELAADRDRKLEAIIAAVGSPAAPA